MAYLASLFKSLYRGAAQMLDFPLSPQYLTQSSEPWKMDMWASLRTFCWGEGEGLASPGVVRPHPATTHLRYFHLKQNMLIGIGCETIGTNMSKIIPKNHKLWASNISTVRYKLKLLIFYVEWKIRDSNPHPSDWCVYILNRHTIGLSDLHSRP